MSTSCCLRRRNAREKQISKENCGFGDGGYSSAAFDRLLERIEVASLDWESGEAMPGFSVDLGHDPAEAAVAEQKFVEGQSWYAADAQFDRQRNGRGAR